MTGQIKEGQPLRSIGVPESRDGSTLLYTLNPRPDYGVPADSIVVTYHPGPMAAYPVAVVTRKDARQVVVIPLHMAEFYELKPEG